MQACASNLMGKRFLRAALQTRLDCIGILFSRYFWDNDIEPNIFSPVGHTTVRTRSVVFSAARSIMSLHLRHPCRITSRTFPPPLRNLHHDHHRSLHAVCLFVGLSFLRDSYREIYFCKGPVNHRVYSTII